MTVLLNHAMENPHTRRPPQSDPEYLSSRQDDFACWKTFPSYERLCAFWGLASHWGAGKVLERLCRDGADRLRFNDGGLGVTN